MLMTLFFIVVVFILKTVISLLYFDDLFIVSIFLLDFLFLLLDYLLFLYHSL